MIPYRQSSVLGRREAEYARIDDVTPKITELVGRALIMGAGEAIVDIMFPTEFSERPVFTFGHELDENQSPVAFDYPTVSATVVSWITTQSTPGAEPRYSGCSVAVVTTGAEYQYSWLHYSFKAKAMTGSVLFLESPDDEL